MKGVVVSGLIIGVAVSIAEAPAQAKLWDFSFVGIDDPTDVHGSGTLTTTGLSSPYTVTGATGTIYDPEAGSPFTITGLSSYGFADNLLYYPPTRFYWYNSVEGISFTTASAEDFNLGGGGSYSPQHNVLNASSLNPFATPGVPGSYNINLTVTAVPEPSTWAMLALGLAGLGALGQRKRPKPA